MMHSVGAHRRGVVAALALLLASAAPASAGPQKISDTIQLKNGTCVLTSAADDQDAKPEVVGPQHCKFTASPSGFIQVSVPGNADEFIICVCKIAPNGTISGPGRENQGPGAYSVTIIGKTKPGTPPAALLTVGAILRVLEVPSAP
jgi:hypothetical protein